MSLFNLKGGESSLAKKLINLYAEDGANIIDDDTTAVLALENTSTGAALVVERSSTAGPTIAPLRAIQSIASGVFLEIQGVFISTASLLVDASGDSDNTAFYIPVYHGTENVKGYIPVIKDALI